MPRKTPTTQRQVIVVNATPLNDDEADYLISRERERTDLVIPFKEFLKRHPRDAEKLPKRNGRQPSLAWKSQLLGGAEHEYAGLGDAVRAAALSVLDQLARDPFQGGSASLRRGHYRMTFYRGQYRMVYKVAKSRRRLVVTRIRRKDEKTYLGHEQSSELLMI
jgi:mRNA-degrading endonuclease RelE of RelBE toxin-antitoxin system